jgi:hypothetical protein
MTTDQIIEESQEDLKQRETLANSYNHRELNLTEEQQQFINEKLSSKLWIRIELEYVLRITSSAW